MLNIERLTAFLAQQGFTVSATATADGAPELNAEANTAKGAVSIYAIQGGACISKPNGSRKFYYKVTNAQLAQYIQQTLKANGGAITA